MPPAETVPKSMIVYVLYPEGGSATENEIDGDTNPT